MTIESVTAWLAQAPAMQGLRLQVDDAGPAPGCAGLFPTGVQTVHRSENLLGEVTLRRRATALLRVVLPLPMGDVRTAAQNTARLQELQAWVLRQSAAHRLPALGNWQPRQDRISADEGRLERTDGEGCGVYRISLVAEYTERYPA